MTAPNPSSQPRQFIEYLYHAAVTRALPLHSIAAYLPRPPRGRTVVLGAGKAGGSMAQAVEAIWPADAPLEGLVVTRYQHIPPRPEGLKSRIEIVEAAHPVPDAAGLAAAQRIEVVEASHPVPDAAGMQAAARILALVQGLTADDLVLCLISGGGSSLLTLPADGLTLEDKQRINRQLLESGADIAEMNCVRKHLSRIKGGRLAAACAPAQVVTLTISDVPGDDPATIASGPTVADAGSCADALAIIDRLKIALPDSVRAQLHSGALETPKPGDAVFHGHQLAVISAPQHALEAAAAQACAAGISAYVLSDEIEGESREVGRVHAALARAVARAGGAFNPFQPPCVLLSGGETTVTVRPRAAGAAKGRGGRAGEFCLGLAQALQGQQRVWALAADTDGIDGVENNAGALVTPDTLVRAQAQGLSVRDHLDRNDAWSFFDGLGDLVVTGPTFTNVNDFRALLILGADS